MGKVEYGISSIQGRMYIMGYHHYRSTCIIEAVYDPIELRSRCGIKSCRGLIQEKKLVGGHKSSGKENALLLPA